MANELEEHIRAVIAEQLGVEPLKVTRDASFVDDLGADSLDTVELTLAVEEELGFAIPEEDAEKLTTLGKILDYLSLPVSAWLARAFPSFTGYSSSETGGRRYHRPIHLPACL